MGIVNIEEWDKFEKAVKDLKPSTIMYSVDPNPARKPPLNLRLVFYQSGDTYVYIDVPGKSYLKETRIPILISQKDVASIEDTEILRFLSSKFKNVDFVAFFDI